MAKNRRIPLDNDRLRMYYRDGQYIVFNSATGQLDVVKESRAVRARRFIGSWLFFAAAILLAIVSAFLILGGLYAGKVLIVAFGLWMVMPAVGAFALATEVAEEGGNDLE